MAKIKVKPLKNYWKKTQVNCYLKLIFFFIAYV